MLLTIQAVQGWVGPTMAISLVVIALSFFTIAAAIVAAALGVSRQARRMREELASLRTDAQRAMKSVRRAARNAADASEVLREQAELFAHSGARLRGRLEEVTDVVHQRVDDFDAVAEVALGELEDAVVGVASSARRLRGFRRHPILSGARLLLGLGRRR
ncbi:MAG: hypothetical protein MUC69_00220 [Gemmatimonadales bacterium]|nr:hypothetical protein [Gemmatimonadales bacterium]